MTGDGCPPGGLRWTDGRCVPAGVVNPPATWVLDYGVTALGVIVLVGLTVHAVRQRRLTWWLLLSVASASTWWLETFGDWGQHLSYSPNFLHYHLDWPFTAAHNPAWMPVMYAVYWVAHAWAILRLAQWWTSRKPGRSIGHGILVLSVPLTFVWNLVIEGFAAYMGWWTYEPAIGPFIDMGRGNWPLLWPMLLMFGWINLIAYVVGLPEEVRRFNCLERTLRLDRLLRRPGWARRPASREAGGDWVVLTALPEVDLDDPASGTARFQVVRFVGTIAYFNATFFLTLVVPLVGLRLITGWGSPFLP
ncbi:hypothetical protein [Pseudonocardia sp.]|jgi:hypothetical protein|uniref:hypothetical protein n=1 Tax=Pseudonocardia sp. TaxID=60912 RepID=UPI0026056B20|nr:hypothetical protein [Pseudonocardia sp.]MCW2717316.1 hypothetical protein [Pseudonocardia sp.]